MINRTKKNTKPVMCQGQPSWRIESDRVEACVTRMGAFLAPVTFRLGRRTVRPYAVAPWAEEKQAANLGGLLRGLRGDFFCLPFGGNQTPFRGEKHPPHGETSNDVWTRELAQTHGGVSTLHLSLRPKIRPGRVDRSISLREGQTALYCRDVVSGMGGPINPGHHAMLRFPDQPGSGRVSTSPLYRAQVFPGLFENPEEGGYSSLKPGAMFTRLERCPSLDGTFADLSRYPARRGFEDLVMLTHRAAEDFAWSAVTFPGERYVWFALKDPRVLASTVLWISNGGRHYAPWSGRHVNVMGIEDVTAYFHYGLAESVRAHPLRPGNIPTVLQLNKRTPLVVNYIMAVAEIPRGFSRVRTIRRGAKSVSLVSDERRVVEVPLDVRFLYQRPLPAGAGA